MEKRLQFLVADFYEVIVGMLKMQANIVHKLLLIEFMKLELQIITSLDEVS